MIIPCSRLKAIWPVLYEGSQMLSIGIGEAKLVKLSTKFRDFFFTILGTPSSSFHSKIFVDTIINGNWNMVGSPKIGPLVLESLSMLSV